MNRKIFLIGLALAAVLLATPYISMVHATPSTPVSGTIMLTGVDVLGASPVGKSDNLKVTTSITDTWMGDIAGTTTYASSWMVHDYVPPAGGTPNIHETIFFSTVNVLGKSGSLTLVVDLGGSKGVFRWNILSGTGELANLHGNGIYYLVEAPLYAYEGTVHFDP